MICFIRGNFIQHCKMLKNKTSLSYGCRSDRLTSSESLFLRHWRIQRAHTTWDLGAASSKETFDI